MKRIYISAVCAVLLSISSLFGLESYRSILPQLSEAEYQTLAQGGSLNGDTLGGKDLSTMTPNVGVMGERMAQAKENSDEKNFALAYVTLIPYAPGLSRETDSERQLTIFNTMRQISTQKEITYLSSRHGNKPYPLFKESSYISDPKDITSTIPDPVLEELPSSLVAYAYQFDTTFDGNVYQHTFTTSDQEIFLDITNMTPIKFRGITGLKAKALSMCLSTYQTKEGILLFSLVEVKNRKPEVKILFWSVWLPGAFDKRITALSGWFRDRISLGM